MVDTDAMAEDLRELAGVWAAEIGIVESAGDGVYFLLGVAGEERGVVGQGNTGDSQVHGADSDPLAAEASEGGGGFGIEGQNNPTGGEVHALDELLLGADAFVRIEGAIGAGQRQATARRAQRPLGRGAKRDGTFSRAADLFSP